MTGPQAAVGDPLADDEVGQLRHDGSLRLLRGVGEKVRKHETGEGGTDREEKTSLYGVVGWIQVRHETLVGHCSYDLRKRLSYSC